MDEESKPENVVAESTEEVIPPLPPAPSSPLMAQRRRNIYKTGDPNLPRHPIRAGRPKKLTIAESEWETIRALVYVGATKRDICEYFRVSYDTLVRECKVRGLDWDEFVTDARTAARLNLRRRLWREAMKSNGSIQALILLAKSELGISDKLEVTGKDGEPIQVNSLSATMTPEQLQAEIAKLLSVAAAAEQKSLPESTDGKPE